MSADDEEPKQPSKDAPVNAAPDAVKDPNEKTEGKPSLGPQGGETKEVDPGGG